MTNGGPHDGGKDQEAAATKGREAASRETPARETVKPEEKAAAARQG